MTAGFWIFRIVHQETGKTAQGVPVTLLDASGGALGHWVSDADGAVRIPRRGGARVRLRVGLRNEDPIELDAGTLGEITDLAAPDQLPFSGPRETAPPPPPAPGPAANPPAESQEVPPHLLYFQRLASFAPGGVDEAEQPTTLSYGVQFEMEGVCQSLGVLWGDLLYSVSLTPGDEARLMVLDGRWRREAEGRERPLQILARMVASSVLGDLATTLRPELQLEAFTLERAELGVPAADCLRMVRDRIERMSHALRRRPLGVVDAGQSAPEGAVLRTVHNTTTDRVVTFHFFEPLERYRVLLRTPRVRPVVFVPFQLPGLVTADVVRRFGYIFQRTLLD